MIGATRWGKPIRSGIVKQPVTAASIYLDTLNLDGDRQADLTVHGGATRPSTPTPSNTSRYGTRSSGRTSGQGHLARICPRRGGWKTTSASATSGRGARRGSRCPSPVLLATSWRRSPVAPTCSSASCARTDRMVPAGAAAGDCSCSWPIQVIERHPAGISVLIAHRASLPGGLDRAEVEAVARVDALAADWRHWVLQQLERAK